MSFCQPSWIQGQPGNGRELRTALGCYPTGVAIIATLSPEGRAVGLTVNSFASVSMDPPLVLWGLAQRSPSLPAFDGATHFSVSVLAEDQEALCRRFANPAVPDKFAGIDTVPGAHGIPLVGGAVAQFECRKESRMVGGDHVVFVGQVESFRWREGAPLLFHGGTFVQLPFLKAA